jgi:hypothetical protein
LALGGLDDLGRVAEAVRAPNGNGRLRELVALPSDVRPADFRRTLRTAGVAWVRRAFDLRAADALRDEVLASCRRLGWLAPAEGSTSAVARRPLAAALVAGELGPLWADVLPSPTVAAMVACPVVRRLLVHGTRRGVGPGIGAVIRAVPPGVPARTTGPHRDADYLTAVPGLVVVWTPLLPCPRALGGLSFVEGSHRRAFGLADGAPPRVLVPAGSVWSSGDYAPGDAVVFDGRTVHRALPNRTRGRVRLSFDFRCSVAPRP